MTAPAILDELQTGWSPSYSFALADLDGDGQLELLSCPIGGGLLRAFDLRGRTRWEYRFPSPDRIGEMPLLACDLDGDGRAEVVLPYEPPEGPEIGLVALRGDGRVWWQSRLPDGPKWYLENQVPPLDPAPLGGYAALGRDAGTRPSSGRGAVRCSVLNLVAARLDGAASLPSIIAGVRGGAAYALGADGRIRWSRQIPGDEPAHLAWAGDLDGDGRDEVALSTAVRHAAGWDPGWLVVLESDGSPRWQKGMAREVTAKDVHVDDLAIAPIVPGSGGRRQLLTASGGALFDADGARLWSLEDVLIHGQWVAVADLLPEEPGLESVISQFHVAGAPVTLVTAGGRVRWQYQDWQSSTMLTRVCVADFEGDGALSIVVGEQAPYRLRDVPPRRYDVTVLDPEGGLVAKLPFTDTKRPDWYYNGENMAQVADVDGDGRDEYVFPTMDGRVLLVGSPEGRRSWR